MTVILVAMIVSKHVIRVKHEHPGSVSLTRVVQVKYGRTESVCGLCAGGLDDHTWTFCRVSYGTWETCADMRIRQHWSQDIA